VIEAGTYDELKADMFRALLPAPGELWVFYGSDARRYTCTYVCTVTENGQVYMVPEIGPVMNTCLMGSRYWFECVLDGLLRRVRPASVFEELEYAP
jgi:hypothetical protein